MNSRVELALGRILRMAARPSRAGDIEMYEQCRAIILDELAPVDGWSLGPSRSDAETWARVEPGRGRARRRRGG